MDKGHKYWLNMLDGEPDIELTSVTTLIAQYKPKFDAEFWSKRKSKEYEKEGFSISPSDIRKEWEENRDRSASRGTRAHSAISHFLLTGELASVDADIEGYFESFLAYYRNNTFDLIGRIELPLGNEEWVLSGTPDFVGVVNGSRTIIDYKTSKKIETTSSRKMKDEASALPDCELSHYSLQIQAYDTFMGGGYSLEIMHLDPNGLYPTTYRPVETRDTLEKIIGKHCGLAVSIPGRFD